MATVTTYINAGSDKIVSLFSDDILCSIRDEVKKHSVDFQLITYKYSREKNNNFFKITGKNIGVVVLLPILKDLKQHYSLLS